MAVVDPDNCNGCGWCLADCPYEAVSMKEHDFKVGHQQSVVDPDLCISCGICAGACPSSSPFRHVDELVTGISIPGFHIKELLSLTENKLRALKGRQTRIMLYGCDHGSKIKDLASEKRGSHQHALYGAGTPGIYRLCIAQGPGGRRDDQRLL